MLQNSHELRLAQAFDRERYGNVSRDVIDQIRATLQLGLPWSVILDRLDIPLAQLRHVVSDHLTPCIFLEQFLHNKAHVCEMLSLGLSVEEVGLHYGIELSAMVSLLTTHGIETSAALRRPTYPPTRYMGSKEALLTPLARIFADLPGDTALDLFSGTGIVSYLLKTQGRRVRSVDYMTMCATFSRAMIENSTETLSADEVDRLLAPSSSDDDFVQRTFKDLYFDDADNATIDQIRANILHNYPDGGVRRDLARAALIRACLKKRPRGIFTYTGLRYDDGRRDLKLSLADHFREQVSYVNRAVFPGPACSVACDNALNITDTADVVYIDPPYFSPLSDNEYVRRYHFLEGLARDWEGVEIQEHTLTKKFQNYKTPFSNQNGAVAAFQTLFRSHADSKALVVSYGSNALPDRVTLVKLLKQVKPRVDVIDLNHRYSVGNQVTAVNNAAVEYLFVAT